VVAEVTSEFLSIEPVPFLGFMEKYKLSGTAKNLSHRRSKETMETEGNPSDQQVAEPISNSSDQQAPPEGYVEKARYAGQVQKVQTLSQANSGLTNDLATSTQRIAELEEQLTATGTEAETKITGLSTSLEGLNTELSGLKEQNADLQAFRTKVNAAKEMGRPDLLPILEHLPNFEDADQLKTVLNDFAGFADQAAQSREQELRAGTTNTTVSPAQNATPASEQAWLESVEKLPLGSTERAAQMDRFGDWLQEKNK
jgi:hypothetical protein